ncbi:MAG: hypothetical protein ABIL58_01750 [Pseudomonadota bacterium]
MTAPRRRHYLDHLLEHGAFAFSRLEITGIDNTPVIDHFGPQMVREETCLFHRSVVDGDAYVHRLHDFVHQRIGSGQPGPVVRFADGEYAFYRGSLDCNGLYRQADSAAGIARAIPFHIAALKTLSADGLAAPLVFPGNCATRPSWPLSVIRRRGNDGARVFLDFVNTHTIALSADNYVPFYAVYAFLTSTGFARMVDGKHVCLINADWDETACQRFFTRQGARPQLSFAAIPNALVAVHWPEMKDAVLAAVPDDADIYLVGAGVGALPVCVDLAARVSRPVIDAGHVVNMMNGMEAKSNGMRMYTLHRDTLDGDRS